MEWQIRERGTDEVLKEFEADDFFVDEDSELWSKFAGRGHKYEVSNLDFNKHYICRKGEILVSEEEYNAIKVELAELKAQRGYNRNSDEALDKDLSVYGEPEKEVTRYNVEEVLAEIIQTSQYSPTIAQVWQTVLEHELEMQRIEASRINQGV